MQQVLDRVTVLLIGDPAGDRGPDLSPGAVAGGQERVETTGAEIGRTSGQQPPGRCGEIEDPIADRHADPALSRVLRAADEPYGKAASPNMWSAGTSSQSQARGKAI